MHWHGLRIHVIILSLLAGIALIFSIQWLYQKYFLLEPLASILKGNKSIEFFEVYNEGRVMEVHVSVSQEADLMQTYKEIRRDLSRLLGRRAYQLVLKDSRDSTLSQVWYNCQYAVYQAVTQGSYQDMAATVNREAQAAGVESKIYIDQENIYIRLKHQGHTLDEVIPRGTSRPAVSAPEPVAGGGASAERN
ncbi:hypothetical membrane protein [Pelotomaculum thermopropionicum SI]|uniref:Hypothetical membrane protein n=1 Tax=Pelotomaculum thermopropionicum (strain DSM 13744 / JCM 10971 / SI) TaxID=370438 RepID=A5D2R5_PELTS|nr:hypothetical membrane protein [Pelotomaculum thermopropionicum SI]